MTDKPKISRNSRFNTEFDSAVLWSVLKRQWFIIPILLMTGIVAGFLYLRYTKPKYESSAVIQRSSQDEGKRILDIENFQNENNLSEDIELLKSEFLLEKALRNLNLEISYYSEGEILTEEKYLFSSYHVTLRTLKDSSLIGQRINLLNEGGNLSFSFFKNGNEVKLPVVPNEAINNEFFDLSLKISKEDVFQKSSTENELYFVFNDYKQLTAKMHPALSVYALNPEARTIKISYQSNNRLLAADVVSSVINTFFEYDLEKKSKSSASILAFIDTQLDTVFLQLKESENQIQEFKDSSKVSDPTMFTQRILTQVSDLNKELMTVNLDFELLKDIENSVELSDRIEIYNLIPAIAGTDFENLLSNELTELHALIEQREDISYSFTKASDEYVRVERKIESQAQNIRRTIDSFKKQIQFRKRNLEDRIYSLESQLYGVPAKEMELSRLNRMFNLNEKYYTLLIEKKTQYAISKAGYTMDNMILQPPSQASLISPQKRFVYLALIFLSLLISLIYILIKYITFNEFHSELDFKGLLSENANFLGSLPKIKTNESMSTLVVGSDPKSLVAESLRHIRSNLQFVMRNKENNLIAVTSSVSGEGKTFVALNLAGIIAFSGKKVVVLDLDLRKPKIHLGLKTQNEKGMSNILAGQIPWKECVQKTEIDGFDYITAGPIPPNPAELILAKEFDDLLEMLREEYDTIIIDNPPVGIVSDGLSIISKADCPIYIFRANYSKRFFTQRIGELMENQNLKSINVVLNGVSYGRGKYGYGYGYGYGQYYGEEEKKSRLRLFKRK
ncbi:MAG: polysaccharide biosynthesis tyrosine autokinase [Crocinitomicaceae bacterium]|nr:polysaccharide biosynthesis tyrosine autokinase [Crocinitomicaceae bacterium]